MSEKSGFLKSQFWSIILIVIVIVMGVEILLLVKENKKLREALSRSRGPVRILAPEEKVPSLVGVNLKAEELKLIYPSSEKTVLFFFSPDCPACEENLEFWKTLYKNNSSKKVRIFGVTNSDRDKTEEFVKKFQLTFPVMLISDLKLLDKYKVEMVPQTMLIDTSGKVQKVWPGPLPANYKKEIESSIL
ncbi:MAG TPA: TlpA disulfide reductase family protein [Terriglobales bacterium]|nr:TlpA disulfide reductase family protein [Terriglobales bacterium]